MTTDLVTCSVTGCTKRHSRSLMMCYAHWKRVPRELQKRVYHAYNNGSHRADYFEVREEALKAAAQ